MKEAARHISGGTPCLGGGQRELACRGVTCCCTNTFVFKKVTEGNVQAESGFMKGREAEMCAGDRERMKRHFQIPGGIGSQTLLREADLVNIFLTSFLLWI